MSRAYPALSSCTRPRFNSPYDTPEILRRVPTPVHIRLNKTLYQYPLHTSPILRARR